MADAADARRRAEEDLLHVIEWLESGHWMACQPLFAGDGAKAREKGQRLRALLASEPAKAPFVSRNEEWGLRPDFTTAGVTAPPAGAEPAKGACADCGGCGGLGWIPAGDEQLGCIDCNGKGTIAPAPPAASDEVREALAAFGAVCLREWWGDGNPGDIDGGAAQEAAEEAGLWHQVERHADGVECEWCGNEGPCGEMTAVGLAALSRPALTGNGNEKGPGANGIHGAPCAEEARRGE